MSHSGAFDILPLPSDNIPIDLIRDTGNSVSVMDDGSADALGLNLLINPSRVGGGPTTPNGSAQQQQQRPSTDLSSGDMGLSGLDDIPDIDVINVAGDSGGGGDFSSLPSMPASPFPAPPPSSGGNPFSSPSPWPPQQPSQQQQQQQQQSQQPRLSPEQEEREKREELRKIEKLERRSGLRATKQYSVGDSLTAIRAERESLSDTICCERAVRQQRKLLTAFTTIVESVNNKLDPFDVDLDGWSESIDTNIEDFDDVFEELYEKYKGKGSLPPELKLMFGVGMSGAVFHMSKVMASNPQRSNGGLNNFMGMMASQGMPGATQAAAAFAQMQPSAAAPIGGGTQQPDPQMMPNGSGPFNLSSRGMGQPVQAMGQMEYPPSIPSGVAQPPPAQRTARREMKGPGHIADEVMQNYARMSEARSMDGEQMAPSGYQGISSASNTAVEMLPGNPVTSNAFDSTSLPSDDIRTVDDMSTVSGRPRRRARRPAAPVGATLSLNV
jgi:hypothetical protein